MNDNTNDKEKPLSPAMMSALRAVARMKGDSTVTWADLLAESEHDDRIAPVVAPDRRPGSKPAW